MRLKHIVLMAVMAFLILGGTANAAIISQASVGPACATCQGGIYTLTIDSLGGTSYTGTLRIDTTNYTGVADFIGAVAIKPASSISNFTLLSAPTPIGNWAASAGGLNANGCSGAGSGFGCAESLGLGASLSNDINEWIFGFNSTTMFPNLDGASVKVLFTDFCNEKVGGIVSENLTGTGNAVPETSSLLMLGGGLFGIAMRLRQRRKNGLQN